MRGLPLSRVWLPGAALYGCSAFYVLFQGGKTSLMLFVMLNALILYLLLGRWSGIGGVQGTRTIVSNAGDTAYLTAGMRVQVKLRMQIPGFWPVPYVIVRDRLVRPVSDESQTYELSFVPDYRRRGEVFYETAPLRRGRYRFQTTECSTRDIFGLFEHQGKFTEPLDLQVYPRMIALKDWQMLRRSQRGVFQHTFTSKWAKETTQIDGVREYIHGDRLSRIHWNATAKTGHWKSKEFEREALPRIVFLLDRSVGSYRSADQFELAVSVAASLLELVVQRGMPLGFVSAGLKPGWFGAERAPVSRDEVLRHLVDVEADGTMPLAGWIAQAAERFEPGVQVVVISPIADEQLSMAFTALEAKRMIPSLLHIAEAAPSDEQKRKLRGWQQLSKAKQWDCNSVSRLEELPAALGVVSA
ncbi:DUF58 domain-containing protein [Cohnella sp. CFH 77786]|uniref:DUF58 domain-containing protein n=1 Tax=Cohnella sp. CFH 77786 TaxID=2662265 RepID=UPI001C6098BB|nr:DUF58 domain-containing protein [Cohnella sp. CFH 77786]MBW5444973.1 DUF58 domain-containing protein [Cohnella sp. CFH 77786]